VIRFNGISSDFVVIEIKSDEGYQIRWLSEFVPHDVFLPMSALKNESVGYNQRYTQLTIFGRALQVFFHGLFRRPFWKARKVLGFRFSGNLNILDEIFHDLAISKSQKVFPFSYKDIHRLILNFQLRTQPKKCYQEESRNFQTHLLTRGLFVVR